jgi:hypothetical protein
MKLTQEQIDFANRELKHLGRIIASEPKLGLFRFVAKQEALGLIVELHNVACAAEKAKIARIKEIQEKNLGIDGRKTNDETE